MSVLLPLIESSDGHYAEGPESSMESDQMLDLLAAEKALTAKNLGHADCLAARFLKGNPASAAGWNLCAKIALAAGLPEMAKQFCGVALGIDRYFKVASKNMQAAEKMPSRPALKMPSYLLIREWGAGFWSDVDHVLGQLLIAEITGRVPVVYWGPSSRFRVPAVGGNAWDACFEPVSGTGLPPGDPAMFPPETFFPIRFAAGGWERPIGRERWEGPESRQSGVELLARTERVVVGDFHNSVLLMSRWIPAAHPWHGFSLHGLYRAIVDKYLRPAPGVVEKVNAWRAANLAGQPAVAVHVRVSDKPRELPEILEVQERFPGLIAEALAAMPDVKVFLMTDSQLAFAEFGKMFPGKVVGTACARTDLGVGLHFQKEHEPAQLAQEVMLDAYIALGCDRLIGAAGSNVACMIARMKDWPEGACNLLGESVQEILHEALYFMEPPNTYVGV